MLIIKCLILYDNYFKSFYFILEKQDCALLLIKQLTSKHSQSYKALEQGVGPVSRVSMVGPLHRGSAWLDLSIKGLLAISWGKGPLPLEMLGSIAPSWNEIWAKIHTDFPPALLTGEKSGGDSFTFLSDPSLFQEGVFLCMGAMCLIATGDISLRTPSNFDPARQGRLGVCLKQGQGKCKETCRVKLIFL